MKIRNGFVSNSSSSSFLVAFPRNPKNVNDVIEMIFGNEITFVHPYGDGEYYPMGYPVKQIAEIIWNDIKNQIPNNRKQFNRDMFNVVDSEDYYSSDYNSFDDDAYTAACEEVMEICLKICPIYDPMNIKNIFDNYIKDK